MELLTQLPMGARRSLRRILELSGILFLALAWSGEVAWAQESIASEPQVKAAFLINFPKYTEWPAEAFAETNSPIIIAVLGETRVTGELLKAIEGRIVNGRKFVVKRVLPGDEGGPFHILFIATEQARAVNFLAKVKGSVLTVGESAEFLAAGGIINLTRRSQKVALDVDVTAAEAAGLKISSKLLNVANVVKGKAK